MWAGNHGDDLAKSPHMARIGSSVFPDICPRDPLCRNFGFYENRKPTPSMESSLLYKLHSAGVTPGVSVNTNLFEHAYSSKYGLVRIYKVLNTSLTSRAWAANPANRLCDRPGSWYCPGQYPPDLPLAIPKSHRHVDYDNPNSYVEEVDGARGGGGRDNGGLAGMRPPDAPKAKGKKEGKKKKSGKKKAAAEVPEHAAAEVPEHAEL